MDVQHSEEVMDFSESQLSNDGRGAVEYRQKDEQAELTRVQQILETIGHAMPTLADRQNLKDALLTLCRLCDRDTRFGDREELHFQAIPLIEMALPLADTVHDDPTVLIANCYLTAALAFIFSQKSEPGSYAFYAQSALVKFYAFFLPRDLSLEPPSDSSDEDRDIKEIIKIAKRELPKKASPLEEVFLSFVLGRVCHGGYIQTWKNLQERSKTTPEHHLNLVEGTEFTSSVHDALVKKGIALDQSTLREVFLLELFALILYTHGRVQFYKKNVMDDEIKRYQFSLKLCNALCKTVKSEKRVNLLTGMLVLRQGLAYNAVVQESLCSLDSSSVETAQTIYQDILKNEEDYFEFGLVKVLHTDRFNKLACLRQHLKCVTFLLNPNDGSQVDKAREHHKRFEDEIKHLDRSTQSLEESLHITSADLYFKYNQPEDKRKAISLYTIACNKLQESGKVRNLWIQALDGLTKACLASRNTKEIDKARVLVAQFFAHTDEEKHKKDRKKVEDFLNKLRPGCLNKE